MLKSRRCDIGRYYDGDIEGKFWFAVQGSMAADRFGVEGEVDDDNYEAIYLFTTEDIGSIEDELQLIYSNIGEDLKLIDRFFAETNGYNDEIMDEFDSGLLEIWNTHKSNYADIRLGEHILECVKRTGRCEFTAEL